MPGAESGFLNGLAALARMARLFGHVMRGLVLIKLEFGGLTQAQRHERVRAWSLRLFAMIGMQLTVHGEPSTKPALVAANHVSWLDIACVHAGLPRARFVSKSDVARWPMIGTLAYGVGTLFIERARKRDALRVVHQVAEALRDGDSVAIFPEGTTGPGPTMLPMHANLLQAAISVGAPVQPVVLRYREPGMGFSVAAQYIGDTSLIQSIWRIASARGLSVEVHFLPPLPTEGLDRRALAEQLRERIQQRLDA
ncbi:MAG TPA: lysophospholipid acyltransferase family protein [Ideonella sp.]|uniref:lysophospholipid acyltransferase family protein n=1 Tax=Ideonella sp. TaxID=1929293 RepID=UPI002BF47B53|nr:lysophospholipid acyltransferase family protein [Ideonella sp.]HSI48360.1 lysophospholipid acyltransferase family protein [Ideonella sp.]